MTDPVTGTNPYVYQPLISEDLADRLKSWITDKSKHQTMVYGSSKFPPRYQVWDFPEDLVKSLRDTLERKYAIGPHIRGYYSQSGRVLPHTDSPFANDAQWTCLIYLSDESEFVGGRLILDVTPTHRVRIDHPRKGWGVIFPKFTVHFTDDHTEGDKVILIVDICGQFLSI